MTDVPTVELACEICGVSVLTARIRIGPSLRRSGWRCARPECAPERDESAPKDAPDTTLATRELMCPSYTTD